MACFPKSMHFNILNKNVRKCSELLKDNCNELDIKSSLALEICGHLQTLGLLCSMLRIAKNQWASQLIGVSPVYLCCLPWPHIGIGFHFPGSQQQIYCFFSFAVLFQLLTTSLHCCSCCLLLQYVKWIFLLLDIRHLAVAQSNLTTLCTFLGTR